MSRKKGFDLKGKVETFLSSNKNKLFTADDIAMHIVKSYPDECQEKMNKSKQEISTSEALVLQLKREITSIYPKIGGLFKRYMSERPMKYSYQLGDLTEKNHKAQDNVKILENKLYDKLIDYLYTVRSLYSMRIDEKRSSNTKGKSGNKWLHPDVVSIEDIGESWKDQVKKIVNNKDARLRLWSFEVKTELKNLGEVREAFFQTVSNSAWANFAYLVVGAELDEEVFDELRMLSSAHGIGLILLNNNDPLESQELIPAMYKNTHYETINRLADENTDFQIYLERVENFVTSGKIQPSLWDLKS